jgi:hypothetical protein
MARTRSPNYPLLDLSEAISAVQPVFSAENRNKFSRSVLAEHLGYSGLNGRALGKIGAVRAYGLIEGSGDDLRLSEDAITALVAPEGSPDRREALERCALKPALFEELSQEFQGLPSENNLKFWLIKRHFTAEAAGRAASTYLSTMRLVSGAEAYYSSPSDDGESAMLPAVIESKGPSGPVYLGTKAVPKASTPGVLQEVFNLQEGPVTLTFPASLSEESFEDLSDYLQLFLRKAKRRAAASKEGG